MTISPRPGRTARARAFAPDPAAVPGRGCDHAGCEKAGEYRAPKGREMLNQYHWFCLDHVREYNASWNYYRGMSPGQIEAMTRADASWQRPTWPLGSLGRRGFDETDLLDPLHLLASGRLKRGPDPGRERMPAQIRDPMRTLGLDWPVSLEALKARYKELAKRHHPDANGGDRAAEERLKAINLAYAAVRTFLAAPAGMVEAG